MKKEYGLKHIWYSSKKYQALLFLLTLEINYYAVNVTVEKEKKEFKVEVGEYRIYAAERV